MRNLTSIGTDESLSVSLIRWKWPLRTRRNHHPTSPHYFYTCLAWMVIMPPPECAAAPFGSVILVQLPSAHEFLLFFCSWVSLVFLQFYTVSKPPKYSSSSFPRICLICRLRCPTLLPRFWAAREQVKSVCVWTWQENTGAFLWIFLQILSLKAN